MDASMKNRLLSKDNWLRLLFMIVFGCVGWILQYVIWLMAAVQVVLTFVMGKPNQDLVRIGQGLSAFFCHIMKYLTYNIEEKPYPFTPWPGSPKEPQ